MIQQKTCKSCGAVGNWNMFVRESREDLSGYWCDNCHRRTYFDHLVEMGERARAVEQKYRAVKAWIASCERPEVLDEIEFYLRKLGARLEDNPKHPLEELCTNSQDS